MARKSALIFGIIFILIGITGFFDNPVIGYDAFFYTDVAHNIIHLLTGIILLYVSNKKGVSLALKVIGIIYLLTAILGLLVIGENGTGELLGFITVNGPDNWLHLIFGIIIFLIGAGE